MTQFEPLSERPIGGRPPREVLRHGIAESALDGETALFDVLPGIGKSRSIPKLATLDIPLSVLTNITENYGQFEDWAEEDGVTVERFPVTTDDCPTIAGDYLGDEEAIAAREAKDDGWPASVLHREFDLPCQQGGPCPYEEKKKSLNTDGPGMLVGNYVQAYNPNYIQGRGVVIDENCYDKFVQKLNNPCQKAQGFIDALDDFPIDRIPRPGTGDEEEVEQALTKLEDLGLDPYDHREQVGEFHPKAPLITYVLLDADEIENGRYHIELPGRREGTFRIDMEDGLTAMRLFDPPDFSDAEFVIALDATPCVSEWKRLLGDDLEHYRLFNDKGRRRYLREQGYEFNQLNSYVWPASGGNLSLDKCEAYLREVYREHGQRPDVISSQKIIEGGETDDGQIIEGLEDRDLGHLWRDHLHYGDLRGKNDLGESELLVVLGSPSRPDWYFEYRAALHGECVQRVEDTSGHSLSYGSDFADDLLESTRRGEVFQAAMRAGRKDYAEATVYIATGMVPEWLETKKVGERRPDGSFDACIRTRNENEKKVIGILQQEDGISGREVARRVDLPKSTALDALNRLRDDDLVDKEGRGRGVKWRAKGVEGVNIAGDAQLERMADFPLDNPIRASRPFSEPHEPEDPREPVDPLDKYPDWILDIWRRGESRWVEEQMKQRRREASG